MLKILSAAERFYPNLYDVQRQSGKPALQIGDKLPSSGVIVDLSEAAKQARPITVVEHEAVKVTIPGKPYGAPDDYVPVSELMKRFQPQAYEQMQSHFEQSDSAGGLSVLLQFAKSLPKHPEWVKQYWEDMKMKFV